MTTTPETSDKTTTFNKHGSHLRWPRIWIVLLGVILILLCFIMVGMEVGHVVFDLYRSTAFGAFILFIPFIACAILVIITAFKPHLLILRIAMILCFVMIVLCLLLIAYDILVLIDPTRCFFLNCAYAQVTYQANSTYNTTVTGWPLYITLPTYFQTNMTAIRVFQSIQILAAALFILFCALYILTYFIYRHIQLHRQTIYSADHPTFVAHEPPRTTAPVKHVNTITETHPESHLHPGPQPHHITMYSIESQHNTSAHHNHPTSSTNHRHPPPAQTKHHHPPAQTNNQHTPTPTKHNYSPSPTAVTALIPKKSRKATAVRPGTTSANIERICTRCMNEPRMVLQTNYDRQNFFSHLCLNCNNELLTDRQKPHAVGSPSNRFRKPK